MRGVGGILLDATGRRFVNEVSLQSDGVRSSEATAFWQLDTRKNVVERMNAHAATLRASGSLPAGKRADEFVLLLGVDASEHTSHVASYTHKKLLAEFDSLDDVARWMRVDVAVLDATLRRYDAARQGGDEFQRASFGRRALRYDAPFYAGYVATRARLPSDRILRDQTNQGW